MSICDDLPKETIDLMCDLIFRTGVKGNEMGFTANLPDLKPADIVEGTPSSVPVVGGDLMFHTHPGVFTRYTLTLSVFDFHAWVGSVEHGEGELVNCIGGNVASKNSASQLLPSPPPYTHIVRCFTKGLDFDLYANKITDLNKATREYGQKVEQLLHPLADTPEVIKEGKRLARRRGEVLKELRGLLQQPQSRIVRVCEIDCEEGRDG